MKRVLIVFLLISEIVMCLGCSKTSITDERETNDSEISILKEKYPALFNMDLSAGVQIICIPKGDQLFDYWMVSGDRDSIPLDEFVIVIKKGLLDQEEVELILKYHQIPAEKVVLRICFSPLSSYYPSNDPILSKSFDLSKQFDGKYPVGETFTVEW